MNKLFEAQHVLQAHGCASWHSHPEVYYLLNYSFHQTITQQKPRKYASDFGEINSKFPVMCFLEEMSDVIRVENLFIDRLLSIPQQLRQRTNNVTRSRVHEDGNRNPVFASIGNHPVLYALVSAITHDLKCISNVDHQRSTDGRDVNPAIIVQFSHVKPSYIILEKDGQRRDVGVAADADGELRVRAYWVVVEVNPLRTHKQQFFVFVNLLHVQSPS